MQRSQCCRILMARSVAGQGATAAVQWREGLMRDRCRPRPKRGRRRRRCGAPSICARSTQNWFSPAAAARSVA